MDSFKGKTIEVITSCLPSPPSMRLYFTLWEVYLQISIVVVNRCAGLCSEFCLVEAKGDRVYSAVVVQHRGWHGKDGNTDKYIVTDFKTWAVWNSSENSKILSLKISMDWKDGQTISWENTCTPRVCYPLPLPPPPPPSATRNPCVIKVSSLVTWGIFKVLRETGGRGDYGAKSIYQWYLLIGVVNENLRQKRR